MRWRRALIPLALAGLTAGLAAPAATQAARAATTSPTLSLAESTAGDTALGTARTLDLPGGGYAVAHAFGTVSVVGASGKTQWQVDTQQLYKNWAVTWQDPESFTEYPQLNWGTDPVDPLEAVGEADGLVNDMNPAATGLLDGRPVVAVAETVGVNMSPESFISRCGACSWPFSVPGSSLHLGTFVSVLDARTGRMIYHELDPGYVTQLAIAGGRLIVGDETGDPQTRNGIGQWGSVSTLRALAISADGTARQAWKYSTGVPWGRLLDVVVTDAGQQPGVAIAWSDTPPGLGAPRPPDGHVLLLDAATGTVRWQVRTPGYPVLAAADDQRGELAVVQQTDPTQSVGYTLTGLSYTDGRTVLSAPHEGALPLSLAVGSGATDGWAVGSMDATMSGYTYTETGAQVTLTDPATGRQLWSHTLPETGYNQASPDGLVISNGTVVVGAYLSSLSPTPADPAQVDDSITALDYRTARTDWQYTGDIGDPMSLNSVTAGPGLVRAVTSQQDVATYAADGVVTASTAAGPGDFISGATASITAPGSTDLVAGNQNGEVYAFDGRALAAGAEQVLWHAQLPGPVQDIVTTTLDGQQVVVAAATNAIGVLDARTGRLLRLITTPGTYAYTATVISAAGTPAVVVPGSSLTAYALTTGARLWSHAAPSGASFSDAAYADGVVAAEYSSAANGATPATKMAAVGVSAATGKLAWSDAADPSVVQRGQLWNGTFASPDIAGANGDGVAFAWADTNGDTQVDVRDIATGAQLYSDTSSQLFALTQFLASPGLGLIAVSQFGSALIAPSGAEASGYPGGMSGALATTPSGQEGFLTANGSVNEFGTSIFTTSSPSFGPSAGTFQSGTLVSGDFAGNGTQQAVAMPANWLGYTIVNQESGYWTPPNLVTVQHGLAMLTLQDAGTSSSAKAQAAPASGATQAAAYPAPSRGQQSVNEPSGSQPTGLRPVGTIGSITPVTEPARTGTVTPETSPATAKHTISEATAEDGVTPPGYSPAQMTAYLGLTGDGKGQTIAIVDAYNDPNIVSDAETFSQQYGLPGVCGSGGTPGDCFTLDVKQQSTSAGNDPGWAVETSLDVEWAHAIAPDATIKLFEASDADFSSLFSAVAAAAATHPAAVSMSWGLNEEFSDETYYDHFCAVTTTVCVVSAGDYGHPGGYPAYNPAVVAVGGTTLNLTASGAVSSEQAWDGSGGGQSWVEPEPSYQNQVQDSGYRQMPDVAFDADLNTGVAVYDSDPDGGQSGWLEVGGTSVGAPSWSAILSDADQLRAASAQPPLTAAGFAAQRAVYSLPSSALAPVTTGPDNGFCPDGCMPGPGYDEITGLGSPRAGIDTALATAKG
jgi:PQQ enzyme repeat/PQQ-like domain